jgi:hypothetical protein
MLMRSQAVDRASLTARFLQASHQAARAMWSAFFFVQRQQQHESGFKGKLSDGKVSGAPYSYVAKI